MLAAAIVASRERTQEHAIYGSAPFSRCHARRCGPDAPEITRARKEVKAQPIEQIMVNNGFNYVRIRTFVNPSARAAIARPGSPIPPTR
jgi:hypothetical protein